MERYPVAGRLLEQPLLLGYTLRDLEVVAVPAVLLVVGGFLGLPLIAWIWLVAVGGILAIGVLWKTPDAQTPREWLLGGLRHHLGPDEYMWQPLERKYGQGQILDVIQMAPSDATGDAAETAATTAEADTGGAAPDTPSADEAAPSGVTAAAAGGEDQSSAPSLAEGTPTQPIFTRVRRLDSADVSADVVTAARRTTPPGAPDRDADTDAEAGSAPYQ